MGVHMFILSASPLCKRFHNIQYIGSVPSSIPNTPNNEAFDKVYQQINQWNRMEYYDSIIKLYESSKSSLRTSTSYLTDSGRKLYNMVINAYLQRNRQDLANLLVEENVISNGHQIYVDTIHILLKDAFDKKNMTSADSMIANYFLSSSIKPTIRTMNIMLEGFRNLENNDKALEYYNFFTSKFQLVPDMYTYSSLVRIVNTTTMIVDIINKAEAINGYATPPLIRNAVESLGLIGDHSTALTISLKYLLGNDSIYNNPSSGDALVAALVHNPSIIKTKSSIYDGLYSIEVIEKMLVFHTYENTSGSSICNDTLKLSNKGFCLLLTHYQRKLRDLIELKRRTIDNVMHVDKAIQHIHAARDSIWAIIEHHSFLNADVLNHKIKLNGRLCDAYLRCYLDDIHQAKSVWKSKILPLSCKVTKIYNSSSNSNFDEIAEKSLEALMYISGYNGELDIALEIALTARKRSWSAQVRKNIAISYVSGKSANPKPMSSFYGNLLQSTLESSIESELGVEFDKIVNNKTKKKQWPVVRLQFK